MPYNYLYDELGRPRSPGAKQVYANDVGYNRGVSVGLGNTRAPVAGVAGTQGPQPRNLEAFRAPGRGSYGDVLPDVFGANTEGTPGRGRFGDFTAPLQKTVGSAVKRLGANDSSQPTRSAQPAGAGGNPAINGKRAQDLLQYRALESQFAQSGANPTQQQIQQLLAERERLNPGNRNNAQNALSDLSLERQYSLNGAQPKNNINPPSPPAPGRQPSGRQGAGTQEIIRGTTRSNQDVGGQYEYIPGFDRNTGRSLAYLDELSRAGRTDQLGPANQLLQQTLGDQAASQRLGQTIAAKGQSTDDIFAGILGQDPKLARQLLEQQQSGPISYERVDRYANDPKFGLSKAGQDILAIQDGKLLNRIPGTFDQGGTQYTPTQEDINLLLSNPAYLPKFVSTFGGGAVPPQFFLQYANVLGLNNEEEGAQ